MTAPRLAGARTRRAVVGWAGPIPLGLAAACSGVGGGDGRSPTTVTRPVTITAWFPASGAYVPFLQSQTELFQQATPQVRVAVEPSGSAEKLEALLAAGTPPDMAQASIPWVHTFAHGGALEPIDAYLDRRGKGDFYDWPRNTHTVEGKMYGWPWMTNPLALIVNRSLFAEKNATHLLPAAGARADWTFDQWKAALRAVTVTTGDPEKDVYGTAIPAAVTGGDQFYIPYVWGNGAEQFDREQTRVTICSTEGAAGLQLLVDLVTKDRLAPPVEGITTAPTAPGDKGLFFAKRIALVGGAPGNVGDVLRMVKEGSILEPFEPQLAPFPHAPGKKSTGLVAVQDFVVLRQAADLDRTRAAMKLGSHLTDDAAQRAIAPIGQLPVRKSVGNIYPGDLNRETALAMTQDGRSMQDIYATGLEIRNLWLEAAKKAFALQQSPREALNEMCRLSEPVMAQIVARRKR